MTNATHLKLVPHNEIVEGYYILVHGDNEDFVEIRFNDYKNCFEWFTTGWDCGCCIDKRHKLYGPFGVDDFALEG